jgi:hypothetical protein
MLKFLMAAVLSAAFAIPANADVAIIRKGTITTVGDADKTFTCHWNTSDWTYTTTAKTIFQIAKKPAGFSDLKVGETVWVKAHIVGKEWVADHVMITIP